MGASLDKVVILRPRSEVWGVAQSVEGTPTAITLAHMKNCNRPLTRVEAAKRVVAMV